jgi:hypothetical protein
MSRKKCAVPASILEFNRNMAQYCNASHYNSKNDDNDEGDDGGQLSAAASLQQLSKKRPRTRKFQQSCEHEHGNTTPAKKRKTPTKSTTAKKKTITDESNVRTKESYEETDDESGDEGGDEGDDEGDDEDEYTLDIIWAHYMGGSWTFTQTYWCRTLVRTKKQ